MKYLTATKINKNLYHLLDDVSISHTPIQIFGKRNSAIFVSNEDWQSVQETLYLTSIPEMRDSIIKGLNTPIGKCFEVLDW